MKKELEQFIWPRGTVVVIGGMPFSLDAAACTNGLRVNYEEATRRLLDEKAGERKWAKKLRF